MGENMRKSRHVIVFVVVLFIVSVITGYIYGINNYYDLTDYIEGLSGHNNLFITHLIIFFLFLFSTISLLGIIAESIYIGFEGVSIGYLLAIFFSNFKLKGILYALVTIAINKLFLLLILIYLFIVSFKYIKKSIDNIIGINKDYFDGMIKPLLQKYFIILLILLAYDTVIYFFGNKLLNYLTFML